MFVAVCQCSKCITYRERCFRPFWIQSPLDSTLLRLQLNAGHRTLSKGHNQKKPQSCPAKNRERGCVTHCVTLLAPGPSQSPLGRSKIGIRHYKRACLRANLWPAEWNAVSLQRQSNTSLTNTVSFFRSEKWKLLILSPSAGMNRLKQRRTKQSQLIKGCIFKQSIF